jgi:hypothetical protein
MANSRKPQKTALAATAAHTHMLTQRSNMRGLSFTAPLAAGA